MKYLHIFTGILAATSVFLSPSFSYGKEPISALREPDKSYTEYFSPQPGAPQPAYVRPEWGSSVEGVSSHFTEESFKKHAATFDLKNHNYFNLQQAYRWIRDLRFLTLEKHPDFLRRITWQYPDDGCFTRAEMAIRKLKEDGFSGLKKIFVFGDLEADTPNSAKGVIYWWFHVAPLVKVNSDYYVIDPSVNPSEILTVRDWLKAMNRDYDSVRLSICHESSYDPHSRCFEDDYIPAEELNAHQTSYLHKEWFRMVELGRNPEIVLGDYPPWGPILN